MIAIKTNMVFMPEYCREEAREMLKALNMMLRSPDCGPISDLCDALDMAIEALSQPIVAKCYEIEKDRIYCSPEVADKVFKALQREIPSGQKPYKESDSE